MSEPASPTIAAANVQSRRLRELLLAPKILVMPGAYDVLSARLFESLGFEAIQGTSGGIAAVHGLLDDELLGLEQVVAIYRELAAAVSVPLNADAEKGYGGPEAVAETVRRLAGAGVAGMNLEDSVHVAAGGGTGLASLEAQLTKIGAVMRVKAPGARVQIRMLYLRPSIASTLDSPQIPPLAEP